MHLRDASEKRRNLAVILTFITVPFSGFMTDIYLPSFPSMANNLNVSEQSIQLTLTAFFLSYGFSQLFVGSVLDSIGRQRPVMISLVMLVLSSVAIAITKDVFLITTLRVVQGVATAFIVVAKRAFFVDIFEAEKRKHYLSYFTIVWSMGPIVAPFLGGYMEKFFSWQANFWFLTVYAAVLLVGELTVGGETVPEKRRFNIPHMADLYGVMLKNKGFLLGTVVLGLSYSVTMVFNIAGPFVVEHHFGFNSVIIGYCTLILGLAWMFGGVVSKRLADATFMPKTWAATILQIIIIGMLIGIGFTLDQLWVLIVFAFFIHIASGFLFTNFFTHNLLFFPKNAGIAGGLMGGTLYIITSFSSYVISVSGEINDTLDMALRYLMIAFPLMIVVLLISRLRQH